MFKFTMESELQKHLIMNFGSYFEFNFVNDECKVLGGRIDILGQDLLTVYIIEIKRDFVTNDTVSQLERYIANYETNKQVVGIAVAPKVSPDFDWSLVPENIWIKEISDVEYVPNPNKKVAIAVTLDEDVFAFIKKMADNDGRSVSSMINVTLKRLMKEKGQ